MTYLFLHFSHVFALSSDRLQRCKAEEPEKGRPPAAREHSRPDLSEPRTDQLRRLSQVPMKSDNSIAHSPLASLDAPRVQIAPFEKRKELLRWRAVESVRSRDHGRDLQRRHASTGFLASVCRRAIEHNYGVFTPVRIFAVKLAGESLEECAEDFAVDGRLSDGEVAGAERVNRSDQRQAMAEWFRRRSKI